MDQETKSVINRMHIISQKHGWKDDDVLPTSEVEARLKIIKMEDPQLWDTIVSRMENTNG